MSELTLFLIRFAYLAILWIFVLSAISVVDRRFPSTVVLTALCSSPRDARRGDAPRPWPGPAAR